MPVDDERLPDVSFGEQLRWLREGTGLTQVALSARSGLSVQAISMLERGVRRSPRRSTVDLLVRALRLDPSDAEALLWASRRARTPAVRRAGAIASAWRALPRDIGSFTGRDLELERVGTALRGVCEAGRGVALCAIDGMPGVGKSAFAIHVAHRLAPRYPDGQVFLDLHGHVRDQRPISPLDALATLLLTAGCEPRSMPADLDGRAAMWRHRLAGKRMLIVLDDAVATEQVRPLLPGQEGCLVLVTSRRRLVALEDAIPVTLGTLVPAEAAALFTRLAGVPSDGDERAATAELMGLCGCLPLAIVLLAGRLRSHPTWTVRHLVDDLGEDGRRLSRLRAEDRACETAFTLSYRGLPAGQQRLFRSLGLHRGRDVDAYAAAALEGSDVDDARSGLDVLFEHHLIDEQRPGRYCMHDLVRVYAGVAAEEAADDGEASIDRLLGYYVHAVVAANRTIAPRKDIAAPATAVAPAAVPDLTAARSAMAWLEAERGNVGACLEQAAARGRDDLVVALARGMQQFLYIAGHWDQALDVQRTAAVSARRAGDGSGLAHVLLDLGIVRYLTGDYAAAAPSLTRALAIFREHGNRLGQANALNQLGVVQRRSGRYRDALASFTAARTCFGEVGIRNGEASATGHIGNVQLALGQYREAMASLHEAIAVYGEFGNPIGQADALTNLAVAQRRTGEHEAAATSLAEALALFDAAGKRDGRAHVLNQLGAARTCTGDHEGARTLLVEALELFREVGDRQGEAEALNNLGELALRAGTGDAALDHHRAALRLARTMSDAFEQARALAGIGRCLVDNGDPTSGTDSLRRALAIYERLGVPEAGELSSGA